MTTIFHKKKSANNLLFKSLNPSYIYNAICNYVMGKFGYPHMSCGHSSKAMEGTSMEGAFPQVIP